MNPFRKLLDRRGPYSPWRRGPFEGKLEFALMCVFMLAIWTLIGAAVIVLILLAVFGS